MSVAAEIIPTEDGSQTLLHPVLGEKYHSERGAVGEAMHVFIRNGFGAHPSRDVRILEVGFGSGLNALLTLREAEKCGRNIHYTAIELYPLETATAAQLAYATDPLFMPLHNAPWEADVEVAPWFTLRKMEADLVSCRFGAIFDVIYFDAFAPDTQPELWSEEIFRRIAEAMDEGGVLVTYSAKGSVKQALRNAGLAVERLDGALGKRHMIRAAKKIE